MFRYQIDIYVGHKKAEELTGFVQADRRSPHACLKAWEIINAHTDLLMAEGLEVGVGELYCEMCVEQKIGV